MRLHTLERRFLSAHLRRCAGCRAFDECASWFTAALRATPSEVPSRPVPIGRQAARRRSVGLRAVAQVASVALVALSAGVLALGGDRRLDAQAELAFVGAPLSVGMLGGDSVRTLNRDALAQGQMSVLPESPPEPKPALPVFAT